MKLRLAPKPLDIGDSEGFETSDLFQAKAAGERLANIVGDLAGHAVIVLDGPWGSGKSVFAKQWAGLLRQRGHAVVEFDAFEHDHLDDAFFPLFGHLLAASDSRGSRFAAAGASLVETAAPIVKAMPSIVVDAALRAGTGGILSLAGVRQHLDDTTSAESDDIETLIRESLNQAATQVDCVQQFRDVLASAVSDTGDDGEDGAPLVFIIDELDRCRPAYALNVLERIKHLFAVDGICFVLVTHLEGLAAMVRRAYGLKEADRYLDKFFQLRFDVPRLLSQGHESPHTRYLQYLAQPMDLSWDPAEFVVITINNLVRIYDLTFRSQERIMLNLALFYGASGGPSRLRSRRDEEGSLVLAAGLCVMRNVAPDLYEDAAEQRLSYEDVISFLDFGQWTGIWDESIDRILWYWKRSAVDAAEHLTEDDKLGTSDRALDLWRRRMAEICAEIDQLWQ